MMMIMMTQMQTTSTIHQMSSSSIPPVLPPEAGVVTEINSTKKQTFRAIQVLRYRFDVHFIHEKSIAPA